MEKIFNKLVSMFHRLKYQKDLNKYNKLIDKIVKKLLYLIIKIKMIGMDLLGKKLELIDLIKD